MNCTCAFLLSLVFFCNGSQGSPMFLQITRNGSASAPVDKSLDINYNRNDAVQITCSVTSETIGADKQLPTLTWIAGGKEEKRTTDETQIIKTEILRDSDDETEWTCKARSESLGKTWSLSAHFHNNKAASKKLLGKLSTFQIILICLGGVVGGSIVLMLCYSMCQCLRKRKQDKNFTDDVPLETKTKKDEYAEVDISKKQSGLRPDEPHITELGIDNFVNCQTGENSYVSYDSPDNDIKETNCDIDSESPEIKISYNKKDDCSEMNVSNKVSLDFRNGSSSDC